MYETMSSYCATSGQPVLLSKIEPQRTTDLPYGGHVHLFRPGTNGQDPPKEQQPRQSSRSTLDPNSVDQTSAAPPVVLPREQVYWPLCLAYIVCGAWDTEVVTRFQYWHHKVNFDQIREQENRERQAEYNQAEQQGQAKPIFALDDVRSQVESALAERRAAITPDARL